ncbi:MAG: pyridoxal phosphate-dependent aminotransferase [Kiloniellaceae bacterium]
MPADEILPLRPEIERLETSRIAEVWQLGFGRKNLIPLWVGEGDLPTPAFICEAAAQAMREGKTFYTHKRGIPELRAAIAAYTRGLYGIDLDDERVTVTSSGMNGIMLILEAIAGPGDNVAVITPVWPNILSAIRIVGGQVKPVGLDHVPEGGFRLDLDRLAAAVEEGTRALFIATPGNPTGWVMAPEEQRAALDLCRERGIWLIADEVYARFVYEGPAGGRAAAPSFLQLAEPDHPLIVVNSFSKTWAMTGWRMGWLVTPASLTETLDRLIEFNTSGAPHFLQYGCLAAIRDGEPFVKEMVERCRRGGELVFQRLSAMPRVRVARPRGSFYAFFAVEGLRDSLAFAKRVLEETAVGLAPGSAFGPGGEGHLRLCFASSAERLSEALDRLAPVLGDGS